MKLFIKFMGLVCTTCVLMFITLPFASNAALIPMDLSSDSIGTTLSLFIDYWKNVLDIVLGGV